MLTKQEIKRWEKASPDLVASATLNTMTRLATEDGIVRVTTRQLAARAKLPVEVIERGINELQRRTAPNFSRITRLRDLSGWHITNYGRDK